MSYYANSVGIIKTKPNENELPDKEQIEFCKKVLGFIKEHKYFCSDKTSYEYKNVLALYHRKYISNGALIQAALDLGLSVKRLGNSPNAEFKFCSSDLNLAILNFYLRKPEIENV